MALNRDSFEEQSRSRISQYVDADAPKAEPSKVVEARGVDGLSGRRVSLRTLTQRYEQFVYDMATDDTVGVRWQYGGEIPPRDGFLGSLWRGVLTQFVVVKRVSGAPIGLVTAYSADLHAGTVYCGGAFGTESHRTGETVEGFFLFINHLFSRWDLRKIYFEVPAFNLAQFSGLERFAEREATLREHLYRNGAYWDKHIFSLRADQWNQSAVQWPVADATSCDGAWG